jgi:hypothetical protein
MIMSAQPVRSQKMDALGTMAGGIAHDFNSTLVPIMGYGELAQQCVGEGSPLRRYLEALELLKVPLPPYVRLGQALSASNAGLIGDPTQLHRVISFKLDFSCRNDRCEVQL